MKIKNLLSTLSIALLVIIAGCSKEDTTNNQVTTAPTVATTYPSSNATNAILNKAITVTFSEEMDQASMNATTITIKHDTFPITGTVTYSGLTAVFTPAISFLPLTTYAVTVSTAAKNKKGSALKANYYWSFTTGNTKAALSNVDLGMAANYLVLAKSAISNVSTSSFKGDLGLSPAATSYITGLSITNATGFATSAQVTGKIYAADMADPTPIKLTTAVQNMITAYNDAAGRPTPDFLELATGNIGGKTLTPGLYKWTSTVTLPTDVTISGNANDVWIFQISGDLSMSAAVKLNLIGGAKASNVFWQVAGEAIFGANSHFEGIILSKTAITFQTGATFKGKTLAQTAAIFDSNAITEAQ